MGQPEDMTIRLLKEVLDEFNVTYGASEKKADLIILLRFAKPGQICKIPKIFSIIQKPHCIFRYSISVNTSFGDLRRLLGSTSFLTDYLFCPYVFRFM